MIILGELFHKKNFPENYAIFSQKTIPYYSLYHCLSNIKNWIDSKFWSLPQYVWYFLACTLKYSFILLPSSQKFRGIVFFILIFCKFYNIRFSCCVKDLYPRTPDFFFSSTNAHALSRHRSRWRDNARKERDSVVLKCINISDVNIE
jgi:hypothetical protein